MPYIDSTGRVHTHAPLLQRLIDVVHSCWLALCLFLTTLFNPNASRQMKPSSSLRERERRRREDGGGGGGPGGGRGTGVVHGGSNINVNTRGCVGGICMQ
ncbi:hypothetical protein JCM6882_006424 [Rhodosporidiobolus microsporus]